MGVAVSIGSWLFTHKVWLSTPSTTLSEAVRSGFNQVLSDTKEGIKLYPVSAFDSRSEHGQRSRFGCINDQVRPFETQPGRVKFDPQLGPFVDYNQAFFTRISTGDLFRKWSNR